MRLRNTILFGLAFIVIASSCANLEKKTNKQNVVQESNNLNDTNNELKNEKILPIKSDALSGLIIADLNIKNFISSLPALLLWHTSLLLRLCHIFS